MIQELTVDNDVEISSSNIVHIIVHPYCSTLHDGNIADPDKWEAKMDDLIRELPTPAVVLSEEGVFEATRRRIRQLDPVGPRYLIKTDDLDPRPLEGWNLLLDSLEALGSKERVVCGTYWRPDGPRWCVGRTYSMIGGDYDRHRIDHNFVLIRW